MLPSSQLAALVLSLSILGSHAQLVVNLQTPPVEDGKFAAVFAPSNTDPSSQFGTSLLGAGVCRTPAVTTVLLSGPCPSNTYVGS